MNRAFADEGMFHFTSLSMADRTRHGSSSSLEVEDLRISSIIVNANTDTNCVSIDGNGFHPRNITIQKGQSVLWTWKDSGQEAHNVIHVNPPESEVSRIIDL